MCIFLRTLVILWFIKNLLISQDWKNKHVIPIIKRMSKYSRQLLTSKFELCVREGFLICDNRCDDGTFIKWQLNIRSATWIYVYEILYDSTMYVLSVMDDWTNALEGSYLIDVIYNCPSIIWPLVIQTVLSQMPQSKYL